MNYFHVKLHQVGCAGILIQLNNVKREAIYVDGKPSATFCPVTKLNIKKKLILHFCLLKISIVNALKCCKRIKL